eukprot:10195476-Alexandrium_andersonii.AAC.1
MFLRVSGAAVCVLSVGAPAVRSQSSCFCRACLCYVFGIRSATTPWATCSVKVQGLCYPDQPAVEALGPRDGGDPI